MPSETITSLLKKSRIFLEKKGIREAKRSAELLLCHALQCKRIDLFLRFDQPLREDELAIYRQLLRRRLKHEPIQYITGTTEFYGMEFHVSPDVLIPRPETEHLVERSLDEIKLQFLTNSNLRILDIGTGSGIIPVVLAAQNRALRFLAIDISEAALHSAQRNAEIHEVKDCIEFMNLDVFSNDILDLGNAFHLIVSNPPYIAKNELFALQPEVRDFEPHVATTDGKDGLSFYERIADIGKKLLLPSGRIILEMGYGQKKKIQGIFISQGWCVNHVILDYSGIERIIVISR